VCGNDLDSFHMRVPAELPARKNLQEFWINLDNSPTAR
jgi:hypothetical protein